MAHRSVGRSERRIDARDKVIGDATFETDLTRDDILHAAVLRSNRTHAIVKSIQTGDAEDMDGVMAIIGRNEIKGLLDDRIRHYGDVIAAVAAEDVKTAREAANAIDYELEPLDAVHDARAAVRNRAPTIHRNNPDIGQHGHHDVEVQNPAFEQNIDDYHAVHVGDVETGFEQADSVHVGEYASPRVSHCNLGTHCTIAEWEGDILVLTETNASLGRSQDELAHLLDIDVENVRIQTPPRVTSSFGGKSLGKRSLEPVAASLARATDRPVKLWFDREEEFVATSTRHRTYFSLKTGVTADGRITALSVDVMADTGAYPNGVGHIVLTNSRDRPLDLYQIPNYRYEGISVFTNNIPAGEYRGIGSTQLAFALESHLDEVARAVGFSPIEFRRRNFVHEGYERPHTGAPIESCGVEECLDRGQATFERMRKGSTDDSGRLRGWGVAAGAHTTASGAHGDDASDCRLVYHADGTLVADTAALEHGQGSDTVMAQIISEETGIPLSKISVRRFPTTDELKDVLGSVASRSTYIIGAAVQDASESLAEKLRDLAATALDTQPDFVTLESGSARGNDGESVPLPGLFESTEGNRVVVYGEAKSSLTPPSYGVHFAEVEVDPETGNIDLLTYVAAQDVGYAINPKMVEGQLEGAVCHSAEFALFSELKFGEGIPQNANLADYPAISPWEMPDTLVCEIIESNENTGPYGAKGIGTPSMPPVAPAILNAVRDATGTRFYKPPVEPETVYNGVNG